MDKFDTACKSYKEGQYDKALIEFKESLLTHNEMDVCLFNIGVCHMKLKNYENAKIYFLQAIKIKNDDRYFYNLSYTYVHLEEYKKAYVAAKMALALKPDDEAIKEVVKVIEKRIIFKKEEE